MSIYIINDSFARGILRSLRLKNSGFLRFAMFCYCGIPIYTDFENIREETETLTGIVKKDEASMITDNTLPNNNKMWINNCSQ